MRMPDSVELANAVNEPSVVGSKIHDEAIELHMTFRIARRYRGVRAIPATCDMDSVFERGVHTGLRLAEMLEKVNTGNEACPTCMRPL